MNAEMLIVFFVAAIFFQLQQNVYGFNQNRIVNGSTTPDGEFEFLTKLSRIVQAYGINTFGLCSSTIISRRHILTAAHCFRSPRPIHDNSTTNWILNSPAVFVNYRKKQKMIQEDNAPNKSAIQNVNFQSFSLQTKYYFHPSYTPGRNFYYDIAIVEFPEGTDLKIPPVKLASNYVEKEGDMAIAAGYGIYKWQGHLKTGIPETPTVLQNVTVPVHMNCTPSITSKVICTATNERFADSGDSGGPLILQRNGEYYQVGVTSMVFKYPDGKVKNAYARVSDYCDWISFITKGHANCESLPDDPNPQPSKPQNQNEPPNNGKDQPTNPVNSNIASNETKIISAPETAALTGNSNFATFNCLFLFFAFFLFA